MTIFPHDWRTAWHVLRILREQSREHQERTVQLVVSVLVPGACGGGLAWGLLPRILARSGAHELLISLSAGILAFTAIVVGFVVSLMLQTGKVEQHVTLSFEQFQLYVDKLRYLLYSQSVTLVACLLLTCMLMLWCVLLVADADFLAIRIIGSVCGALLFASILRTFLLPLQIYELHDFGLDEALKTKREQVNRDIRDGRA